MKKLLLFPLIVATTISYSQTQGDLTHSGLATANHDSTLCQTEIMVDHFIQKNNSFMNDIVEVIDFGGQVMYTETNFSGSAFWAFNLPFTDFDVAPDYLVSNNTLNTVVSPTFYKLISGLDTVIVDFTFVSEPIPNPCSYQTITGKTYIDKNADCTFNAGDVGVGNYMPTFNVNLSNSLNSFPSQYSSNANGEYTALVQESYFNSASVNANPLYQFTFPNDGCAPNSYTVSTLPQTGLDFVLQCADIDVSVYGSHSVARPTVPFTMFPSVINFGCDTISGVLNLILDPYVTYNAANSSNPADIISGDTLKWIYTDITNVANSAYWQTFTGGIELTPDASLNAGDVITFQIFTDVPANDVDATNNSKTINITLVNSYDPNFKEVSPKGLSSPGYISAETEVLTYTIHFQNTGNAPALNIFVIDSLEANIIPSSLRILDASHAMTPDWIGNNTIKFNFNNINLADSVSNEPQSHGYVMFEIDMEQNLSSGDEIKNKADIYFDNNAPIITNYALNTIEYLGVNENSLTTDLFVSVYPNPCHGQTTVTLNNPLNDSFEFVLYDLSGKTILSKLINSNNLTLNTAPFENGVYFYRVINTKTSQVVNGKLIIE